MSGGRLARWPALAGAAAIFAFALAVRAPGIDHGRPLVNATPDERNKVFAGLEPDAARGERRVGPWVMRDGRQPEFLTSAIFVWLRGLRAAGVLPDEPKTRDERFDLVVSARALNCVFAAATAALLFLWGRAAAGTGVGAVAGLLFAVSPLAIGASHYVKEDVALAMFTVPVLWQAMRLRRRPTRAGFLAAGVLCGLAAGAKYAGALLLLAPAATWLLARGERAADRPGPGALALALAGFAAAFVATSPLHVVHFAQTLEGGGYQLRYIASGHRDAIAIPPTHHLFAFYARKALGPGIGWPAFSLAAATLLAHLARPRGPWWVPAAWCLAYLLLIELSPSKPYPFYARYAFPLVPPLCLFAAQGAAALGRSPRWPAAARALAPAALSAALLAAPAVASFRAVRAFEPDTREQAQAWLASHVGEGDLLVTSTAYAVADRRAIRVRDLSEVYDWDREAFDPSLHGRVLVLVSSFWYERYLENERAVPEQAARIRRLLAAGRPVREWSAPAGRLGYHNPTLRLLAYDLPSAPRAAPPP